MTSNSRWNKKVFSIILAEAKGMRSWRQFAMDCGISYVQMRKLAFCAQENPPRPKLIRKVAAHSFGDIDLEDFMFAAGIGKVDLGSQPLPGEKRDTFFDKYRALSAKDKKTVELFVDFISQKGEK